MINPIYAGLFPKRNPDPIWNAYAAKIDKQINKLYDNDKLLDAYILAVQGRIEYHAKKRDPGDECFGNWIVNSNFLELSKTYPDFRYVLFLCWFNYPKYDIDFLVETLNCLTAMREGCYIPMSHQAKVEIQKLILKDSPERYEEIVGDEDALKNSLRN